MATPTSAKQWKQGTRGEEVSLPSGNVALLKRPGIEKLFAAGVLPDELTKGALELINQAERGGRPADRKRKGGQVELDLDAKMLERFMQSENAVGDIFDAFDRVTEMCVIEPKCVYHRRRVVNATGQQVVDQHGRAVWEDIPEDERDEDILYTDEVDSADKMFIFNFVVGGSRDIERFRDEFGDALATVQPGEDVADTA